MNTFFLVICTASILFFTAFLVACMADSRRKLSKHPVVHKLSTTEAVDFATGRRWLIHLEQQMAEFLTTHAQKGTALLLAVGLIGIATQMKAQSSVVPASPTSAPVPPMSRSRRPYRSSLMPCRSASNNWKRS
jgi:hypothetical protein